MQSRRSLALRGFTLVELMVVIAILAILSAVAIVSFAKYRTRARTTEAYNMLGLIRMRQEAYRSEFSQYANVSATVATFWPATVGRDPRDFMTSVPAEWLQLGVRPTGPVFFQYMTVAGTPPAVPNIPGAVPVDLGYSTQATPDMWWVAQARGDLDGDGVQSLYETASFTNRVFTQNETE